MIAIAAMAENRVIGCKGSIPWHVPDEFKWFKKTTMGHILLMGRKTYESIGRALPGRETWILSRSVEAIAGGVRIFDSFEQLPGAPRGRRIYLCGGAELYKQLLWQCDELLLSVLPIAPRGDVSFPRFEHRFELIDTPVTHPDFEVRRYKRIR